MSLLVNSEVPVSLFLEPSNDFMLQCRNCVAEIYDRAQDDPAALTAANAFVAELRALLPI